MSRIVEVTIPEYPPCWETCGSCANGEIVVADVLVKAGDVIRRDDTVITLETGKTTLDIPTRWSGRVIDVRVKPGDTMEEGAVILTVETGSS